MPELPVVTDVQDLVAATRLMRIETVKLASERYLDAPEAEVEISPTYTLQVNVRDDAAGFRARFGTSISMPVGEIQCDVVAEYEIDEYLLGAATGDALAEYVNGVVLMHVLPYVRHAIADLTLRTFGTPLLMPVMQRGEISFDVEMPAESGATD